MASVKGLSWKVLTPVFLTAFFLRLLFGVFLLPEKYSDPQSDARGYHEAGLNLAEGNGFTYPYSVKIGEKRLPDISRPPLYPFFLSATYRMWGPNLQAARIAQGLVGAGTCLLIAALGTLLFTPAIGLISGWLSAFYPPFIFYWSTGGPGILLSENLYLPVLALVFFWFFRAVSDPKVIFFALCGLWLGLASLTRPEAPGFVLWLGLGFLAKKPCPWRRLLKNLLVFALFFAGTVIPWPIRNYRVSHQWVFLSTVGESTFYAGNNPLVRGSFLAKEPPEIQRALKEFSSPQEARRFYLQQGLAFWRTHPGELPLLFFKKLLISWGPFTGREHYNFGYGYILPLMVIGMGVAWAQRALFPMAWLLFLPVLHVSVVSMVFCGDSRFRYPVEPYLILFASSGLSYLWETAARRRKATLFLGMWCCLTTVSGLLWPQLSTIFRRPLLWVD